MALCAFQQFSQAAGVARTTKRGSLADEADKLKC